MNLLEEQRNRFAQQDEPFKQLRQATSSPPTEAAKLTTVRLAECGISVGDLIRSTDRHWLKNHDHLVGVVVKFEPVPERAIEAAGSDHWAYLESGEGPISLAVIERVPVEAQSLRNLNAALQRTEGEKPVVPTPTVNSSMRALQGANGQIEV